MKSFARALWSALSSSALLPVVLCTLSSAGQAMASAATDNATQLTAILAKIETLKTQATPISDALDRERDRNGKLRQALLGQQSSGCFSRQSLSKLEIEINGTHLANSAYDPNSLTAATPSDPNASQVTFTFSDRLKYIQTDEEKNNIFMQAGKIMSTNYSTDTIGDIEYLSISKGGVGYYTEQSCKTGLFGGKGKCEFHNQETEMYRLDSIAVYANDQLIYKNDAVSFSFKKGTLTWNEYALTSSPDYLKLMSRTDCPLSQ